MAEGKAELKTPDAKTQAVSAWPPKYQQYVDEVTPIIHAEMLSMKRESWIPDDLHEQFVAYLKAPVGSSERKAILKGIPGSSNRYKLTSRMITLQLDGDEEHLMIPKSNRRQVKFSDAVHIIATYHLNSGCAGMRAVLNKIKERYYGNYLFLFVLKFEFEYQELERRQCRYSMMVAFYIEIARISRRVKAKSRLFRAKDGLPSIKWT
jgi:hypothetical protein